MDAISYTAARANLAQTMKRVCADHEPMIITRNGEPSVVMVSLDDFKALEETAYLLRTPTNARRLMDAIVSLVCVQGAVRSIARMQPLAHATNRRMTQSSLTAELR
ncbi:MAG: type II toxin-antitoxin system Phd/YefM family antitoxin, partial [Cyanobium sp.]